MQIENELGNIYEEINTGKKFIISEERHVLLWNSGKSGCIEKYISAILFSPAFHPRLPKTGKEEIRAFRRDHNIISLVSYRLMTSEEVAVFYMLEPEKAAHYKRIRKIYGKD